MILGDNPCAADLCRDTSSALRRIEGQPQCTWYVFDYVVEEFLDHPYLARYNFLQEHFSLPNVQVVQSFICYTMEEVEQVEQQCLDLGYEGICIRDPDEIYKQGRCGKTNIGVCGESSDSLMQKPWLSRSQKVITMLMNQRQMS